MKAAEVHAELIDPDVLEHADRADRVVRPVGHIAVVLHPHLDAVAEVGVARARVWRLYMAAAALNFERGDTNVYQLLATRSDGGRSGMGWRPDW